MALRLVRKIGAPPREVVEYLRERFVPGGGEVWAEELSGDTLALARRSAHPDEQGARVEVVVRESAAGSVLVAIYRGPQLARRTAIAVVGAAFLAVLALEPVLGVGAFVVLLLGVIGGALLLAEQSRLGAHAEGNFTAIVATLDGALVPLALQSPYRAALPAAGPGEPAPVVSLRAEEAEATVWMLPPRSQRPPAPEVAETTAETTAVAAVPGAPTLPALVSTGDPRRRRIEVLATPAEVRARLLAAFPEDGAGAEVRSEGVTPTSLSLVRRTTDAREPVASVEVRLEPIADGTCVTVLWTGHRPNPLTVVAATLYFLFAAVMLTSEALFGVLMLGMMALVYAARVRGGPTAQEAFELLVMRMRVPLYPLERGTVRPDPLG